MRKLFALVALALAAGCTAPDAAPATGATPPLIEVEEPAGSVLPTPARAEQRSVARVGEVVALEVRGADGTMLRGHAYLPDAPPPYGVVLGFGPYWGGIFPETDEMETSQGGLQRILGDTTYDALLRAGFAVVLFNVRGTGASEGCYRFFDPRDGSDAARIVEALAAQPWAAAVGMYGVSYDGWTQYAAMASGAKLAAAAPVSGILDVWSAHTRNGATARIYAGAGVVYAATVAGAERSCPEGATETARVDLASVPGDRTPELAARDMRGGVARSGIPALVTYGLARPQMPGPNGEIAPMEGLVMNAADLRALPNGSAVLVGPWGHGPPAIDGFPDLVVAWFDHHLRDAPRPALPGARYQDDLGGWHVAAAWPPEDTPRTVALHGARSIASSDRPPGWGVDASADQASWTFPAPEGGALLAGQFRLRLDVTASAPDGNFAAYLFAKRDGELRELARAHTDLRHRGHLEKGEPFPVGAATAIDVRSAPFASRVEAGDELVLVVGGGDGLELVPKPLKPLLVLENVTLELPLVESYSPS